MSPFINKNAMLGILQGTVTFLVKDLLKLLDQRYRKQTYVIDFINYLYPGKGSMFPFSHNAGPSSIL